MAVKPHKSKTRKSQQIEPLDWSAMAQSPAFRGMVSFLEVTPEDIQRQRTTVSDSRTGSDAQTGSGSRIGSETPIGNGRHPACDQRTALLSRPRRGLVITLGLLSARLMARTFSLSLSDQL